MQESSLNNKEVLAEEVAVSQSIESIEVCRTRSKLMLHIRLLFSDLKARVIVFFWS